MKTILKAGAVAGALDILDAFLYFGYLGVSPIRILQSIASGVLGKSAYQGGHGSAALGLFLHFVIATGAAAVYYAASRHIALLRQRPVVSGALYGIAVYLFMNFVVLPLSAFGAPRFNTPGVINGLFAHIFCVGLPISLITARDRGA